MERHTRRRGVQLGDLLGEALGTLLDSPYGENIVAGTGHFPISKAMQQFVLDESDYDPANPTYNHFTQVV